MPIFLERFVLPAFAAAIVLLAIANPMKFDTTQRITGVLALIFAAYFVAHTAYKEQDSNSNKHPETSTPRPEPFQQAAVIDTVIDIPETNLQELNIQVRNVGRTAASDVQIEFTVQIIKVFDQSVVREPVASHKYSIPKLAVFTDRWDGQRFPLRITSADVSHIRQDLSETLRVKGTISYDNGSPERRGEKETIPFCQIYLFFRGRSTIGPRMVDCSLFDSVLRDIKENDSRN